VGRSVQNGSALDEEFLGDLEDLVNALIGRLLHYQQVLREHGIALPYGDPLTESDLIRLVSEEEP